MKYQKLKVISLKGIVILCVFFLGSASWAQDEPGLVKAADGEPGFYYTIQKGDTLWDLSRKFYNSQWDWPGLWEMNKDIKNPHRIYPGEKIRVYLKEKAPVAQVSSPPQATPQAPRMPDPITPTFIYPGMDRVGFIKKAQEKSLGSIIRERDKNVMMSTDDIVYIKPAASDALNKGQTYQIFNVEQIKEKFDRKKYTGVKHTLKGRVEIINHTDEYVVGKITEAYRAIEAGDMLMPYAPADQEIAIQKHPDPIDAVLVCSDDNTVMINDRRIAFINKGNRDNVRPGQIYSIYQSQIEKTLFGTKDTPDIAPLFVGELIVLRSDDLNATVMVISSKRDIHPGDMVN